MAKAVPRAAGNDKIARARRGLNSPSAIGGYHVKENRGAPAAVMM
jgi:hypothetical protein